MRNGRRRGRSHWQSQWHTVQNQFTGAPDVSDKHELLNREADNMSMRTYMISLQSLEPIKKAVGSKDQALLDALRQAVEEDEGIDEDDIEDFQSLAEEMVIGPPPAEEPGAWSCFIETLAEYFELSPRDLPLNDWKHADAWKSYRSIAAPLVPEHAKQLLEFLESGRPFVGSGIDHDGCMFAWLTAAEAQSLFAELSAIDAETFRPGDVDKLHEELVESLRETTNRNADLFLGAQ